MVLVPMRCGYFLETTFGATSSRYVSVFVMNVDADQGVAMDFWARGFL